MVHISDLTKQYNSSRGIFNLNLEIPRGETRGVIGPSGCGKTTLLHTLAGLLKPDSGSLDIAGESVRIGLVQQKDALFPWLTALDNVLLGVERKSSSDRKEAMVLMDELGVAETATRFPSRLSGGERQRISLARTLICKPDLLLLDEPTASLDEFSKEAMQNLLLRIQSLNPVTTLFVTHSMEEALFLGQEILVMGEGSIRAVHKNPFYPDPAARDHKSFYSEVLKLRESLKKVAAL
jgi:NitT/TauT family transport system ATP-binding protein